MERARRQDNRSGGGATLVTARQFLSGTLRQTADEVHPSSARSGIEADYGDGAVVAAGVAAAYAVRRRELLGWRAGVARGPGWGRLHGQRGDRRGRPSLSALARARGVPFLLVTNNSTASPEKVAARLGGMGIEVTSDEVLTSAQAAAGYVAGGAATARATGAGDRRRGVAPGGGRGGAADRGWPARVGDRRARPTRSTTTSSRARRERSWAARALSPPTPTRCCRSKAARSSPARAASSPRSDRHGRRAGRRRQTRARLFEHGLRRLGGLRPHEVAMIGDRLDTDVVGGHRAGLRTILVLSGVTTRGPGSHSRTIARTPSCRGCSTWRTSSAGAERVMRWEELQAPGRGGIQLHVRRVVDPPGRRCCCCTGWASAAASGKPSRGACCPTWRPWRPTCAATARATRRPRLRAGRLRRRPGRAHRLPRLEHRVPVVGHSLGALVALALADPARAGGLAGAARSAARP